MYTQHTTQITVFLQNKFLKTLYMDLNLITLKVIDK